MSGSVKVFKEAKDFHKFDGMFVKFWFANRSVISGIVKIADSQVLVNGKIIDHITVTDHLILSERY